MVPYNNNKYFQYFNISILSSISDKELIACETAIRSFLDILDTVGGQNEKCRAKQLLSNVKVLSDIEENEENSVWQGIRLRLGKKIRERTYKIFAFGMYHKALTVTANKRAIDAILAQVRSIYLFSIDKTNG